MKYLTEKEFEKEMTQIKQQKRQYEMRKDGIPFANMTIAPPTGKSFANKEVILTFEAVKNTDRKYAKSQKEESAVFRVSSISASIFCGLIPLLHPIPTTYSLGCNRSNASVFVGCSGFGFSAITMSTVCGAESADSTAVDG